MDSFIRSVGRSVLLRLQVISAVFVVLFVTLAVFVSIDGVRSKVVKTTTGIVDVVTVHTKKGAYDHSTLKLLGGNVQYSFDNSAFTPTLTDELLAGAAKVDLWYTENVLGVPRIIALQIYDEQGEHPTKYVSRDYIQPDRISKEDSIVASICAVTATISAIAFAILLQVGRRKRRAGSDMGEAMLVRSGSGGPSVSSSPLGQRQRDEVSFWEQQLREQQRER